MVKRYLVLLIAVVAFVLFITSKSKTVFPKYTVHTYVPEIESGKEFTLKIGETTKLIGTDIELKLIGLEQPPEVKDCGEWCFVEIYKYVKTELKQGNNLISRNLDNNLIYQLNQTSSDYKTFANFVFHDLVADCQEMQDKKDIEIHINNCWTAIAERTQDVKFCDNTIGSDERSLALNKTRCLENVADMTKDLSICDKLEDKSFAYRYCGYMNAVTNKDLAACGNLLENYDIPCIKDIFSKNNWGIEKCSSLKTVNNKQNAASSYLRCIQVISGENWFNPTTTEQCKERFENETAQVCEDYVKFRNNN